MNSGEGTELGVTESVLPEVKALRAVHSTESV